MVGSFAPLLPYRIVCWWAMVSQRTFILGEPPTTVTEGSLTRMARSSAPLLLNNKRDVAIVTLVASPQFILSARVLQRSIIEVGGRAASVPLVMLHTFEFEEEVHQRLLSDGWLLRRVDRIPNPFDDVGYKQRMVFTKLMVWSLEDDFDRIIYVDADCVVLGDLGALFDCRSIFCAANTAREIYSGRFNSGVMVLSPNRTLLFEMLEQTKSLGSYNSGDQGFLNEFIPRWCLRAANRNLSTKVPNGSSLTWTYAIHVPGVSQRCTDFGHQHNHISFLGKTHGVNLTHFNHPVWWVVKPWCWRAYPTHWVFWEWHYRRAAIPDQAKAAKIQMLVTVGLSLLLTAANALEHRRHQRCWILKVAPCMFDLPSIHSEKKSPSADGGTVDPTVGATETHNVVQQSCCRKSARAGANAARATCLGLLLLVAMPGDLDAIVGWAAYAMLKSSIGGAMALCWNIDTAKTAHHRICILVSYYIAVGLEMLLMWIPSLILRWSWTSDRLLTPICWQGDQMLYRVLDCTAVAIIIFAVLPMTLSFFTLFLVHLWLPGVCWIGGAPCVSPHKCRRLTIPCIGLLVLVGCIRLNALLGNDT